MSDGSVVTRKTLPMTKAARQINVILRNAESTVDPAAQTLGKTASEHSERLPEIFRTFDGMIGLGQIRSMFYEIYALTRMKHFREEAGLKASSQVYHMIYKGNPGTGKTTVARMAGKFFQELGILGKGHFIEVERADLVGEYIGHTAQKTRELVKKAFGGILFIDEAYSLARGGEKDFGKEAIDTLVKSVEDFRDQFVLILAGYSDEMDDFLLTNPGLRSRFPIQMNFPDYTVDQLMQIAGLMLKERDYVLVPQAEWRLQQWVIQEKQQSPDLFDNARFIRNVVEKAIRSQAVRLLEQGIFPLTRQEMMTLRQEDIRAERAEQKLK